MCLLDEHIVADWRLNNELNGQIVVIPSKNICTRVVCARRRMLSAEQGIYYKGGMSIWWCQR